MNELEIKEMNAKKISVINVFVWILLFGVQVK